MQTRVVGLAHEFLAQPDALNLSQQASSHHAPIGRQLFHSRPYGALFDRVNEDEKANVLDQQSKPIRTFSIFTHGFEDKAQNRFPLWL